MVEEVTKTDGNQKVEEPKMSVLDETKAAIAELKAEREEFTKIRDELNTLRSDQLLSGTGGIREEPAPVKEETAQEYQQRVMSGGLNAKATEED